MALRSSPADDGGTLSGNRLWAEARTSCGENRAQNELAPERIDAGPAAPMIGIVLNYSNGATAETGRLPFGPDFS